MRRALLGAALLCAAGFTAVRADTTPPGGASAEGQARYLARCAACHGTELQGGQHAPPIVGADFRAHFSGKPARAVYSRILSTMPQDDPGSLSEPDALAIALYVFFVNQISLGSQPITNARDLNAVRLPIVESSTP